MQSAILWWQTRPSVRHTPVLYRNECTYRKLFPQSDRGMNLVFQALSPLQNSKGNSLSGGVKHMRWENMRFSTEIAIYLGNGTSTAHGYYGALIGLPILSLSTEGPGCTLTGGSPSLSSVVWRQLPQPPLETPNEQKHNRCKQNWQSQE